LAAGSKSFSGDVTCGGSNLAAKINQSQFCVGIVEIPGFTSRLPVSGLNFTGASAPVIGFAQAGELYRKKLAAKLTVVHIARFKGAC
jgi:hypothetical protein